MRIRLLAALAAAVAATGGACAQAAPNTAGGSTITKVEITESQPVGTFGGVAYRHLHGVIHGEAAADEPVAGLRELAAGRASVPYETSFDLVLPQAPTDAQAVVVEASNRGMGVLPSMMSAPGAVGPGHPGGAAGDGFLPGERLALARIQWQTGIAPGVPQTAQGLGEVIARDFGRWLGGAFPATRADLPVFRRRILAGVSQSAWFVNSFIVEGFNADPQSGGAVYQGAFTRDGNGVVLAINRFAAGAPQFPYVPPKMTPLTPAQLLARPKSDPVLVDVSALTDYYRVRASVFARAPGRPGLHRYASLAPHAPGAALPPTYVFATLQCNGGQAVPLSRVSDALYLRPLLLGLAQAIGARTTTPQRLPPDAPFVLAPAPADLRDINRLEGVALLTPKTGAGGAPEGGLPMLEAVLPLGVPEPPAIPPVGVSSINDTCGNFGGWRAFDAAELARRYGSRAAYLARAKGQAATLVQAGYLLADDQTMALDQLEAALPPDFH